MNRREFINKSGTAVVAGTALANTGVVHPVEAEKQTVSLESYSDPSVGPYPHMWTSEDRGPYIEQIGLGLATLKVGGAGNISMPIWPAFKLLAKAKDPIRSVWTPHGYSPVEPDSTPDPDLELVSRDWHPHALKSRFRWRQVEVEQDMLSLQAGAMSQLRFARSVSGFRLEGESNGSAAVQRLHDGVKVKEMAARARPVEYRVRLHPAPDRVEVMGTDAAGVIQGKARWQFHWNQTASITVRVTINDGNGLEPDARLQIPDAFPKTLVEQKRDWARYYQKQIVRVETPDERINRLVDYLGWVYRSNGLYRGGLLNHRFNMPKQTFWAFWCWDCSFNAISGRFYHDRELVWGNLQNMPNVQLTGSYRDGCIVNSANYYGPNIFQSNDPMTRRIGLMPNETGKYPGELGDGSHPPIVAQGLHAAWETEGRRELPPGLLQMAQDYHDWWERRRRSERYPDLLGAPGIRDLRYATRGTGMVDAHRHGRPERLLRSGETGVGGHLGKPWRNGQGSNLAGRGQPPLKARSRGALE